MRPFSVEVVVRNWDGDRVGVGASSDAVHAVQLPGGQNPKVRQLSPADTIASGGSLQYARFEIGPLTPDYPGITSPAPNRAPFIGGGEATTKLDPPTQLEQPQEVLYRIKGPGLPTHGMLCKKAFQQFDRQIHYTITVDAMTESQGP